MLKKNEIINKIFLFTMDSFNYENDVLLGQLKVYTIWNYFHFIYVFFFSIS